MRSARRKPALRRWAQGLAWLPLAAFAASDTPLFDYARDLPFIPVVVDQGLSRQLTRSQYELKQNPPPEEDCVRTLGANRFAEMYDTLGGIHAALGETSAAIDAFRKSLGCNPRNATVHASLASELMHVGNLAEARLSAERGLTIDAEHPGSAGVLMQLDFIEERWPAAIAGLRRQIAQGSDEERNTYWQCFLWLAQLRSGVRQPVGAASELTEEWPRPILDWLQGSLTEEQLLEAVQDEDDDRRQREKLSEALFYVGQQRLARGDVENARLYLTATVNLKVVYFIEHNLAFAELAKMRARNP